MKGNKKHATFGVFIISETGAETLYRSRDKDGKPLTKFSDAIAIKQDLHDTSKESLNLIVRAI